VTILDAIKVDGSMGSTLRAVSIRTGLAPEVAREFLGSMAQDGHVRIEVRQYLGVEAFEVFHAVRGAR
jgi:DNA-binding IclR family transcriptional regulator